jgi:hypothetical protein
VGRGGSRASAKPCHPDAPLARGIVRKPMPSQDAGRGGAPVYATASFRLT